MIYCYIRINKIIKFKRKRIRLNLDELLSDPVFRALVSYRKLMKELHRKYIENDLSN